MDEMLQPGTEMEPAQEDSYSVEQEDIDTSEHEAAEIHNKNLAEDLDDDKLTEISERCKAGFEADLQSREEWDRCLEEWIALASQTKEEKSFPWPNASNVKYPLLTTAAMQFAARAYPSLIPSNGKLVKSQVIGKDPDGAKYEKAERVSDFMSYQILHEMTGWEEDMDKMLMQLPVVGTMFKKTWYDKNKDQICSKVLLPKNVVVNYWTTSLEDTERISEIIWMSKRVLKEHQNKKIYRDVELGEPMLPENAKENTSDDTVPYEIIEQHTFEDIDDDGYPEPYIISFERNSGKILSIQRRFTLDNVEEDEGKILKITPTQFYTKFGFVPNPDGSFYDIGFGLLLGPINDSVNTVINQLIDSGSLSNLQGGFIGKALKLRSQDMSFRLGEWKPVNATGDDLRKQIVPLPSKEPSNVLFQLMGSLITSGKELASVAEIFVGKMPGQNTPATTTMASIEQGMKVFTAVYKRLFRSLATEFKKIYDLNRTYLDPHKQVAVLDTEIGPEDFNRESYDICPGADPTAVSQTEKLLKAQGLMELLGQVPQAFDVIEIISRVLEAQEQPNWQKVFSQEIQKSGQLPPPPPDPKLMAIQAKMKADTQKSAMDVQQKQQEMQLNARDKALQMQMQQEEHTQKMQQMQESAMVKSASDIAMANIFASTERSKAQQTAVNTQQAHNQKMVNEKEKASLQKQTLKNGSNKKAQKSS